MHVNKLYQKAIRVLQPSRAEMDRRLAPARLAAAQAKAYVDSLNATPEQHLELYKASSAAKRPNEPELAKAIRVELLGRVRKGV